MARLPAAEACIVAEQIRPEPRNKSTILGFFGLSPNVVINLASFPSSISLAMMVVCGVVREAGNLQLEIEMLGPDGLTIVPRTSVTANGGDVLGQRAICALNFQGLLLPKVGQYVTTLFSAGTEHSRHSFMVALDSALTAESSKASFTPKSY